MPFRFRIGDQVVNFDNLAPGADELDELIDVDVEAAISGSVLAYDGVEWIPTALSGLVGPTGPTGATGATGATGPTGPQGDAYFSSPSLNLLVTTGTIEVQENLIVSGNLYFGNAAIDKLFITASSYFAEPVTVNSNKISGSFGGNITLQSAGSVVIAGDLQIDGNDIKSSNGSTSITLSSTNATVTLPGDLIISGSTFVGNSSGDRLFVTASSYMGQTLSLEKTGTTATGESQLYINGTTSNRIDFAATGLGAPSIARSTGTKLVLWPGTVGASVDYALGMDSSTLWHSIGNSSDSFKWYAGATEIARLTGAGNLGLGITPTVKLDVDGAVRLGGELSTGLNVSTGDTMIELGKHRTGDGNAYIDMHAQSGVDFNTRIIRNSGVNGSLAIANAGTGGISIDNQGAGSIRFRTNGVERMNVASTGEITTVGALTVGGDLEIDGGDIKNSSGTIHITLANSAFSTATTTTVQGILRSNGSDSNTTALAANVYMSSGIFYRSTSSAKYKKDIENLNYDIVENVVNNLRPVWYRSKTPRGDDKPSWSHIGLIAEEVHTVEPRLVQYLTTKVSTDDAGNPIDVPLEAPEPENVDYARLSVILLAEIKSQKGILKQLIQKIEEQNETIERLNARVEGLERS